MILREGRQRPHRKTAARGLLLGTFVMRISLLFAAALVCFALGGCASPPRGGSSDVSMSDSTSAQESSDTPDASDTSDYRRVLGDQGPF